MSSAEAYPPSGATGIEPAAVDGTAGVSNRLLGVDAVGPSDTELAQLQP